MVRLTEEVLAMNISEGENRNRVNPTVLPYPDLNYSLIAQ